MMTVMLTSKPNIRPHVPCIQLQSGSDDKKQESVDVNLQNCQQCIAESFCRLHFTYENWSLT